MVMEGPIRPLFAPFATRNVADRNLCMMAWKDREGRYLRVHQGTWEALGNRHSAIGEGESRKDS